MLFEARIGDRFESSGLDVVWIPRGGTRTHGPDTAWIRAIRKGSAQRNDLDRAQLKKRRRSKRGDLNGRLYNVSVSGAGVVAETDDRCSTGSGVTVELEPGNFFDARIRRMEQVEESGSTYYGLEYIQVSDDYRAWLHEVSIAHHGYHPMTPAALMDHGGLRTDPSDSTPRSIEEPEDAENRTEQQERELTRRHQRSRELATAFLPDPVFEIDNAGRPTKVLTRRPDAEPGDPATTIEALPYHDEHHEPVGTDEKPNRRTRREKRRRTDHPVGVTAEPAADATETADDGEGDGAD